MAGISELAARIAELEGIPSRIAREVADGISAQLRKQFDAGTGPDGTPWAPLLPSTVKRKRGDTRILRRTDRMSGATMARPESGAGVEVISIEYAEKHQTGTRHMVARPIVPDAGELPDAWSTLIEDASARAFKKALR